MLHPQAAVDASLTRIVVLLATHNGALWLDEQLQSIAGQTVHRLDICASDDDSYDATPALLRQWQDFWGAGQFTILRGRRRGFADNFRNLVAASPQGADYYAFCDQDDVWLPGKLDAAVARLCTLVGPGLYCERTVIVDSAKRVLGRSPLFRRPPSFRNALVQSIAGGNTMVLNRQGFALMREACRRTDFVSHDWFTYLIVTGAGGTVHYSDQPHVLYRQHGANLVGSNRGVLARAGRLWRAINGQFAAWNEHNLASLRACRSLLTEDAREAVDLFAAARSGPLSDRVLNLERSGVYRQTALGQLSLRAACVMGKL